MGLICARVKNKDGWFKDFDCTSVFYDRDGNQFLFRLADGGYETLSFDEIENIHFFRYESQKYVSFENKIPNLTGGENR